MKRSYPCNFIFDTDYGYGFRKSYRKSRYKRRITRSVKAYRKEFGDSESWGVCRIKNSLLFFDIKEAWWFWP